jgi:hypothetical protein
MSLNGQPPISTIRRTGRLLAPSIGGEGIITHWCWSGARLSLSGGCRFRCPVRTPGGKHSEKQQAHFGAGPQAAYDLSSGGVGSDATNRSAIINASRGDIVGIERLPAAGSFANCVASAIGVNQCSRRIVHPSRLGRRSPGTSSSAPIMTSAMASDSWNTRDSQAGQKLHPLNGWTWPAEVKAERGQSA